MLVGKGFFSDTLNEKNYCTTKSDFEFSRELFVQGINTFLLDEKECQLACIPPIPQRKKQKTSNRQLKNAVHPLSQRKDESFSLVGKHLKGPSRAQLRSHRLFPLLALKNGEILYCYGFIYTAFPWLSKGELLTSNKQYTFAAIVLTQGELFLMDTTKIGYSEVLLYPHSELDYNGSVNMGSLATSTNIGVGVVAAVLGQSATPLLVTILEEMGTRLVMTELHLWDFEEGHCWFTLVDESGMINQSAIVWFCIL